MTIRAAYDLDRTVAGPEIAKQNLEYRKKKSDESRKAAQWDQLLASEEFQGYLIERGLELRPKLPAVPSDPFTESATLGAMLQSGRSARKAIAMLRPAHFYVAAHRYIFRACILVDKDMRNGERVKIDVVTVAEKLRAFGNLEYIGGARRLFNCIEACPSAINMAAYISILHSTARRRFLFQIGQAGSCEALAPDANDAFIIAQMRRGLDEIETHSMCNTKTLFDPTK